MVSAGLSVIREDKLLPIQLIQRIEALPKHERSIFIGKLSLLPAYTNLAKIITDRIKFWLNEFCIMNSLVKEDILSVKRDAVFLVGNYPTNLSVNMNIKFNVKSSYSVFMRIGQLELFISTAKNLIHVKGIDDTLVEKYHRNAFLMFILDFVKSVETQKLAEAAETLQLFKTEYTNLALPVDFYRELNSSSLFRMRSLAGRCTTLIETIDPKDMELVDISFNFKIILFLARLLVTK